MIAERQHELSNIINNDVIAINQSRLRNLIYQLQNQLQHQYENALMRLVHYLIVFLSICSTYFFDNCTSTSIYLSARQLLQRLHEHHLHYSSRYLRKTYAFARQIDAFSSLLFRRFRSQSARHELLRVFF